MSTATLSSVQSSFATILRPGAELALVYADALVKSIPADRFDHMPSKAAGSEVNSPAFNLGHLANYPDLRILPLLGREDLVKPLPYSADLFKAGSPCVDEPGRYPSKELIVATFFDRYRVAIDALSTVPDERFHLPNPAEGRMRELFPTIGSAVAFLLVGHTQSHLGQISVWRRLMGLGSAM